MCQPYQPLTTPAAGQRMWLEWSAPITEPDQSLTSLLANRRCEVVLLESDFQRASLIGFLPQHDPALPPTVDDREGGTDEPWEPCANAGVG